HTSFILKNKPSQHLRDYQLDWKLYPTGPAMIQAFKNEEIDMGYIGLPPTMIGIDKGLEIKCVAGGHVEGTVMVAPPSYQTYDDLGSVKAVLKQFEGENIGTPSRGSIHDIIIRDIIQKFDIKVENYPWADFIPDAIKDGEIAAGVGTPSLATTAQEQLNTKIVVPPSRLWPYNPSYGIVVKEDLISESQEFILNFLKAHEEASKLIRNKGKVAAKIAQHEMDVVNYDFVLKTYKISPRYCASLPDPYINSTLKFIPTLQNLGYLKGRLKREDIFNTEFIKEVHPEKAHY
ncbi:MAG: ABC transporter substrate-binding protein, partial [Methanobacterium sp.]|nr:ABC transporter substrate-binding protein [Methanobacterium sp.]